MNAWTEATLQQFLAAKFNKGGSLCVPNCGAFGWEADLIRVSPALIASEYEIKLTLADFRADSEKQWKHATLAHDDGRRELGLTPQRFFYVAPRGLIPLKDVPEYAGLVEVYGNSLRQAKPAPKLHNEKISLQQLMYIARGVALRYWRLALLADTPAKPARPSRPSRRDRRGGRRRRAA